MNRHGPHILGLGKGLLLFIAFVMFISSGLSHSLIQSLDNTFYAFPAAVYPAYWMSVVMAGLLLSFPLTLAQDHMMRSAEGQHEEMPVMFWISNLALEIAIGTAVGCVVAATIYFQPHYWWLMLATGWMGYHIIPALIQSTFISRNPHKKISLPMLLELLEKPLLQAGIKLHDVFTYPDEVEEELIEKDIFFIRDGRNKSLYIPREWADTWSHPEITAVTLHKYFLNRLDIMAVDYFIMVVSAVVCFGGFAVSLPWLTSRLNVNELHPLTISALMIPWALVVMSAIQVPAMMIHRFWMYRADSQVAEQMKSTDGMVKLLERAMRDEPSMIDPPRWAEVLFFSAPSLPRRVKRMAASSPSTFSESA